MVAFLDEFEKKHKLTVFLIKKEYAEPKEFLAVDGYSVIDVNAGDEHVGKLVYKGGFRSKPSWVEIFRAVPEFDAKDIWNQSSKALFIVKWEARWFCFTFGHSRHLIEEHAYERDFGLKVALNLSDPQAIKSIDKTNIGYISLHSKEQATREIELGSFEFDDDIDLLKSITGRTPKDDDGKQETFSGRDSVSMYTKVSIALFADVAKRLHSAFVDTKYKERYPWLDKVRAARDKVITQQLDAELVARMQAGNLSGVWLAIPEVVIWEDFDGFSFTVKKDRPEKPGPVLYQDIEIHDWLEHSKNVDHLDPDKLRSRKVLGYWKDGRPPSQWSIYRCLNAEITLDGKKYILNDGDWYNIDVQYVTEINAFFRSIEDSALLLPPYGAKTEPEYLKAASSASPDYALMDRKEVMIGGKRSRVEFCDLYSKNRDIIHVKRYGGSSLLSHLFSQALVSGESFLHDVAFRSAVNDFLPDGFKLLDPFAQPDPKEYAVCIAIMSKEPGPLEIPFFGKVAFRHAVTTLQRFGYRVSKLKIGIG